MRIQIRAVRLKLVLSYWTGRLTNGFWLITPTFKGRKRQARGVIFLITTQSKSSPRLQHVLPNLWLQP